MKGPALVKVMKEVSCLGVSLVAGDHITVRRGKVLPFEALNGSGGLDVSLGSSASCRLAKEGVGVKIWSEAVGNMFSEGGCKPKKIMLIGENDSGKSTLSAFIANSALKRGLRVVLVDGDVGQGDLVPPGCVGMTQVKSEVLDLRDLVAERLSFIGVTSPRLAEDLVVTSISDLVGYCKTLNPDLCIINTDGYVRLGGLKYKTKMIGEVKPDLVFLSADEDEVLKGLESIAVVKVGKPREEIAKSPLERERRRLSQYRRFLRGSRRRSFCLRNVDVSFLGETYWGGGKESWENEVKVSVLGRKLCFVSSCLDQVSLVRDDGYTVFVDKSALLGMFVALLLKGDVQGFGVVKVVSLNEVIIVETSVEEFDEVGLSLIRVDEDIGSETVIPFIRS